MAGYIGSAPARQRDTQNRVTYSAAAGQTSFAATYTPGYVDVYVNGSKRRGPTGLDFTATTGTSIVLANPCALGDVVDIVAIKASSPYDFYTKAQADALAGVFYTIASGTGDAMAVTTTPLVASLADGMDIKVRVPSANTVVAPTITFSNLGLARTISAQGGQPLVPGAWVAGQEITLRYNATGARFEYTESVPFSSNAEVLAGLVANKAVTPAGLLSVFSGSSQAKAPNGYQKLPGGVIIQWGNSATNGSAAASVTFPIAMSIVASVNLTVSGVTGTGNTTFILGVGNIISSGFSAWSTNSSTLAAVPGIGFLWIATGY